MTGIPFIIAAPSGTGKTSLVKALLKTMPQVVVSVSYTTRPQRSGEQADIDYHFVSQQRFEALIAEHSFLEYAKVFEYYYGTERVWVEKHLRAGFDVILEIDWQGAQSIRAQLPSAVSIFILPPSLAILQHRLLQRGQDNAEVVEKRMQEARQEMSHYSEFDYLIVNDNFDAALADLQAIMRSEHLRLAVQSKKLSNLVATLLE